MMKLIPQWKKVWLMYSTHALILAALAPVIVSEMFKYMEEPVPHWLKPFVAVFIAISGIIGRVVQQFPANQQPESSNEDPEDKTT